METKINLFSEKWCDLVFEDKNKDYGAFTIRKSSSRSHLIAISIASVIFTLAVSAPLLIQALTKTKGLKEDGIILVDKFKIEKLIDVPTQEIVKPLKKMMVFKQMIIKPDEDVKNDDLIMSQDDILKSKDPIGNETDTVDLADLNKKKNDVVEPGLKPFVFVEQMPEFPGGEEEMLKFLSQNIVYPGVAVAAGIEGTVYLKFVVTSTGKVSDISVERGVDGGCSEEAIRVVKTMPDWKPGKQNGQAVPVYFNLPVKFVLR